MKYEFVPGDEKVIAPGRTVKRIRALIAISYCATPGALGGYIENESSLSRTGNAQVSGNAQIIWFSHVGSEHGTLTAYNTRDNTLELTRGCFRGTIDEFLTASEKKHDEQTQLEYRMLIEVAYMRITKAVRTAK